MLPYGSVRLWCLFAFVKADHKYNVRVLKSYIDEIGVGEVLVGILELMRTHKIKNKIKYENEE